MVSAGDLLDMRTSKLELAFIQGRQIDLNKQKTDPNARYLERYAR